MDAERKRAAEAMFRDLQKAVAVALVTGIVAAYALAKLLAGGAAISSEAKPTLVLYPLFVMFLLVAAVLTRMGWLRIGGVLVHSYVHLTFNDVPTRLAGYVSSGLVLLVFWVSLFTQILRAA